MCMPITLYGTCLRGRHFLQGVPRSLLKGPPRHFLLVFIFEAIRSKLPVPLVSRHHRPERLLRLGGLLVFLTVIRDLCLGAVDFRERFDYVIAGYPVGYKGVGLVFDTLWILQKKLCETGRQVFRVAGRELILSPVKNRTYVIGNGFFSCLAFACTLFPLTSACTKLRNASAKSLKLQRGETQTYLYPKK